MRINKVRVQKFRNISDTTLDAGGARFVVIRGRNGQGKSSLSEAIGLALADTTFGLDKRGAGFARKVKRGESKATIEVELQGAQRTIRRTTSLSVTATGRTSKSEDIADPEWIPTKFEKLLSDKKTALDISVNTRAFQSMVYSRDEDAQKNLLAQLVLPARYDFPRDTVESVEALLGEGVVNFEGEPFTVIGQAYKKLFELRAAVNKKVKEFVVPDALQRPQGVNSESLREQLSKLREERQKQAGERDAAAKRANEAALKRARETAKIETLTAVVKAGKESLRMLEANILPDHAMWKAVAGRKEERDRLFAEKSRLSGAQEFAKKEQSKLMELAKMGGACPTCEQDIDDEKVAQLMSASMEESARLTDAYEMTTRALSALGDIDGALDKLEKHNKALAEKDAISVKIEEDERLLKAAQNEASKDVGTLFESTEIDSAISDTDRKIETILQQIQPVTAAEERDKDIATKRDQLKKLEEKASKLDLLVKYFDKDGIKSKLIAEYIGSFENKVNEVLSVWQYSCSLSIEPFKFEITDYRNVSTSLIDLSGAEELMFYAAFQCAVSRTAGIGFVVIDRVDTLLPDLRPSLFKNLYDMVTSGTLDQVILLVADTSDKVPKLANSSFYIVEEGNIRRIG